MEENKDYISVIVFSASSLVREGIRGVLTSDDHIRVIGEASKRVDLVDYIFNIDSNVVVVYDEDNDRKSTLEIMRLMNQQDVDVKVIMLIEDYDTDKEIIYLESGVKGFLPERAVKTNLIKSIRLVHSGQMWVRREVMGSFIQQLFVKLKRGEYLSPSVNYFTKREIEIIIQVNKGYKNKEIARALFISEKTVKHHLTRIFKKLGVRKRSEIKHYF